MAVNHKNSEGARVAIQEPPQNSPRKEQKTVDYIPSHPTEVKGIVEAVNLTTLDRSMYLKGESQICPFPLDLIPNKVKDLATLLDEQIWDHADPDHEVAFLWPAEVQPWDSLPAEDGFLFFERKPRRGEVTDEKLEFFRARAAERANPRPVPKEEVPRPVRRRDNVLQMPEPKKRPVRHDRPPRDVMKYTRVAGYPGSWEKVAVTLYCNSQYRRHCDVPGYHGKSIRMGRFYFLGVAELVRSSGVPERTAKRIMARAKKDCFVHECKRGNKERGCSVWELPLNVAHVKAWRRKHKEELARAEKSPGIITRAGRAVLEKLTRLIKKPIVKGVDPAGSWNRGK